MAELDADYFSNWYAKMETSDKDALWARLLGLPDGLRSTSLLTSPGLDEVAAWLALDSDDVLLDLACGRGGYGMELVRRSGCRLVGVDFALSAVEQARAHAERLGLGDRVSFELADMTATGLEDGSVTAVLCVDAAQFPQPFGGPVREAARVLAPGGRAAFTAWEPVDPDHPGLRERLRTIDFGSALRDAGFDEPEVRDRPDWLEAEMQAWRRVLEIEVDGDPALLDLQEEAHEVLSRADPVRRVWATGRKPGRG